MLRNKLPLFALEICLFLCALKNIFYRQVAIEKEEQIENFFQEKKEYGLSDTSYSYTKMDKENYVGVVEIPTIHVKAGFFSKESKFNSVEYGIEVIKSSKMPNEIGNLILASHSGTSSISYFRNIHQLEKGNIISIYYKGMKYMYRVSLIYEEKKDGSISLPRVKDKSLLTLTTCKGDKQLILVSELVFSETYK